MNWFWPEFVVSFGTKVALLLVSTWIGLHTRRSMRWPFTALCCALFVRVVQRALLLGSPVQVSLEEFLVGPDGALYAVIYVIFAILAVVAFWRQARRWQESMDNKFRAVAEAMRSALIVADSRGRIMFTNIMAERIFKWSPQQMVGASIEAVIPQKDIQRHRDGFDRYLQTGEPRIIGSRVDMSALRSNGEEFEAEVALGSWRENGDSYFVATIRDVSTERLISRGLDKTIRLLQKEVDLLELERKAMTEAQKAEAAVREGGVDVEEVRKTLTRAVDTLRSIGKHG